MYPDTTAVFTGTIFKILRIPSETSKRCHTQNFLGFK